MEKELKANQGLNKHYENEVADVMHKHGLKEGPLLLFGDMYDIKPARLLHGMLASVLSRFAACWEAIYDEHVRSVLRNIPKENINFDARFTLPIKDPAKRQVVDGLQSKRRSYLKYMAAAADMIDRAFPRGRLWTHQTVHREFSNCLQPFIGQGR